MAKPSPMRLAQAPPIAPLLLLNAARIKPLRLAIMAMACCLPILAIGQVSGPVSVGPDSYAFTYTGAPALGLYFNATDSRYEFRDNAGLSAFWLNPQTGHARLEGRLGIGVNPAFGLDVRGGAYIGDSLQGLRVSPAGDLRFDPGADFLVDNNRYAFRAAANEAYGLFFNAAELQYEFRDGSAAPVFSLGAGSGSLALTGTLRIGDDPGTPPQAGMLRFSGGVFQGYDGEFWATFGLGGSSPWLQSGSVVSYDGGPVVFGPDSSSGPARLVWHADRSSLSAGDFSQAQGNASVALGAFARTTGQAAFAAGSNVEAHGDFSAALGNSRANANYSFATGTSQAHSAYASGLGNGQATGIYSTALGNSQTSNDYTTAGGLSNASGRYSSALGRGQASGEHATALGESVASGEHSVALGRATATAQYASAMGQGEASAFNSTALGRGKADANFATAAGDGHAQGFYSFAAGSGTARGYGSMAMGFGSLARGDYATALGNGTDADGAYSIAAGQSSTAAAHYSLVQGQGLHAQSSHSLVLGRYNALAGDSILWNDRDPILVVGNGTGFSNRSNALTVLKDGSIGIGTASPRAALDLNGAIVLGFDTASAPGAMRYNGIDSSLEVQTGNGWRRLSTGASSPWQQLFGGLYYDGGTVYLAYNAVDSIGLNVLADAEIGKMRIGRGGGSLDFNTALGYRAMQDNTTGFYNTAVGWSALENQTSGAINTAVGNETLSNLTNGGANTAIGAYAGNDLNGNGNTAIGAYALDQLSVGDNNVSIGRLSMHFASTGSRNTAVGQEALFAVGEGDDNTAVGHAALRFSSGFNRLVAVGDSALANNGMGADPFTADAQRNTAVGSKALQQNTTGGSNTALGFDALRNPVDANGNTAIGNGAAKNMLGSNSTAVGNLAMENAIGGGSVAVGAAAMRNANSSFGNTAVGYAAGFNLGNGMHNVYLGHSAGYNTTDAERNIAIGREALREALFDDNVAIGDHAIQAAVQVYESVAIGSDAANSSPRVEASVAIGNGAFFFQSAFKSTAIGAGASSGSGHASRSTFIGEGTSAFPDTIINGTAVGYNATVVDNSSVRVGSSSVTSIGGYANWTNVSDKRFKEDLQADVPGLAFIQGLRPVTYHLNVEGIAEHLREDTRVDSTGRRVPEQALPEEVAERKRKSAMRQTGFLAQDVAALADSLGFDFSGVDRPQREEGLYGLRYAEFVVPLVKAVQEQQTQIDSMKAFASGENPKVDQDSSLQAEMAALQEALAQSQAQQAAMEQRMDILEQMIQNMGQSLSQQLEACCQTNNASSAEPRSHNEACSADVEALWPNPSEGKVYVRVFIPQAFQNAKLHVMDALGRSWSERDIKGTGTQTVQLNTSSWPAGPYTCALVVDGKLCAQRNFQTAH